MIYLTRGRSRPHLAVTDMRPGTRVTIYKSGAGWTYIAGLEPPARQDLLWQLKTHLGPEWPQTEKHLLNAARRYSTCRLVINCAVLTPRLSSASTQVQWPRRLRLVITCSGPESLLSAEIMNRDIGLELPRVAKILELMLPSHA